MKPIARSLLTAALLSTALLAHAGTKGYLGLGIAVDGEGAFWNPTLKTVKVAKVTPGSPAAKAGIAEGDHIVEIEGKPVAGAKANDLKPYMDREVGQQVNLVIKKPSGELKPVAVTAGPKPAP